MRTLRRLRLQPLRDMEQLPRFCALSMCCQCCPCCRCRCPSSTSVPAHIPPGRDRPTLHKTRIDLRDHDHPGACGAFRHDRDRPRRWLREGAASQLPLSPARLGCACMHGADTHWPRCFLVFENRVGMAARDPGSAQSYRVCVCRL